MLKHDNPMQPGDLVRITRASIGAPKDSIGLIVEAREHTLTPGEGGLAYTLYHVQILKGPRRRYLTQDLRKIS